VTLFSAVMGALALALLVRRLGELGVGLPAAIVTAGTLGVSFSFWRVSVRAEVYTLSLAMALLALGAVLAARRSPQPWALARAGLLLGLVLSVHLSFAPAVAVAGLSLAAVAVRRGPRGPLVLLAAFALGLTPYLMLVALDAAHTRVNFLDLVRHAAALLGPGGPPIDSPWRGVWWLVTGRNVYPPHPIDLHPRSVLAGLGNAGALLALFELGPLAVVLAAIGLVVRARRDRSLALLLGLALAASMAFAGALQVGAMLHLFQLPAILIGALLVADGVDAVLAPARKRWPRSWAPALALWAALALPPLLLRVRADRAPIGPGAWQVREEDRTLQAGWWPGMPQRSEAEPWARAALDSIPPHALVMAMWSDFTPLRHLRLTEARRPDLEIDQIAGETLALRLHQWQSTHAPASAPIVFTSRGVRETPFLGAADSIAVGGERWLYVLRQRLDDELLRTEIARARAR
jgi:hypothetical protein